MLLARDTYCPIDTGALRSTALITAELREIHLASVDVQFGGPAAPYAAIVHEDLYPFHAPPTQAKFLERAAHELSPQMTVRVGEGRRGRRQGEGGNLTIPAILYDGASASGTEIAGVTVQIARRATYVNVLHKIDEGWPLQLGGADGALGGSVTEQITAEGITNLAWIAILYDRQDQRAAAPTTWPWSTATATRARSWSRS